MRRPNEPILTIWSVLELGWTRRPDLSTPSRHVWERPDGQLYTHHDGSVPLTYVGAPVREPPTDSPFLKWEAA